MGELRAYVLGARALRDLLLLAPDRRRRVEAVLVALLPPPPRPAPLGPIHTRVPGTPVVRVDDPTPADLDLLLAGAAVPPERAAAAWRVVEAVAAATASATTRATTGRPAGLAPLGLPVARLERLETGSWSLARAAAEPALRRWVEEVSGSPAEGAEPPEVVVFWEAGPRR